MYQLKNSLKYQEFAQFLKQQDYNLADQRFQLAYKPPKTQEIQPQDNLMDYLTKHGSPQRKQVEHLQLTQVKAIEKEKSFFQKSVRFQMSSLRPNKSVIQKGMSVAKAVKQKSETNLQRGVSPQQLLKQYGAFCINKEIKDERAAKQPKPAKLTPDDLTYFGKAQRDISMYSQVGELRGRGKRMFI